MEEVTPARLERPTAHLLLPCRSDSVPTLRALLHRDLERWEVAAEVAGLLHVSPKTVSRWAQEGKLPFLRTLGGHRRYPDTEIRALAEELRMWPIEERRAESR